VVGRNKKPETFLSEGEGLSVFESLSGGNAGAPNRSSGDKNGGLPEDALIM
jgi:hypothetical protein